ncbi:MAG: hypothetical protein H7Y04_07010 [Verrucomicrobia bacterium]|nr:hypothetical protein [Cytophagales bacterium]
MQIHILGIRHHGVGSAKNVLESLKKIQPDMVLVEGPPELDTVIPYVTHKEMKPPVAVLAYNEKTPSQAVFYPFAKFSPEWQAISYALQQKITVRMMDLPTGISFGMELKRKVEAEKALETQAIDEKAIAEAIKLTEELAETTEENSASENPENEPPETYQDPIGYLAKVAGYDDGEHWWEHHFEQKFIKNATEDHFEAVILTMETLREHVPTPSQERDDLREAYMRKIIRQAAKDGYKTCVIVCGAWHAPVLRNYQETEATDEKMLQKLPSVPVKCTWIPWTNTRLGMFTGYGAGIVSPGWYEHLWHHGEDKGIRWLARVARLFRDKKMDTSTAHVIEAFRLAEALAAMRDIAKPGLLELNEATQTVICFGDSILLKLVEEELIVGKSMIGKVPSEMPKLPIQSDFELLQQKNRLEILEANKEYELDLRKELDLNRSRFLHRLVILEIDWAKKITTSSKGTFKEGWRLKWQPELMIQLIEKGIWGNSIEEASSKFLLDAAQSSQSIAQVAGFMQKAIPAELFAAVEKLLEKINELASISADIMELMAAMIPLVDVSRYGNVRKTDLTAINQLVNGLLTRVCIGLPNACYGLDEENSNRMFDNIKRTNEAVRLLESEALTEDWFRTLKILLDKNGVNPIITGCTCRLLFDGKVIDENETGRRFGMALSAGNDAKDAAAWLEGFLKGSGMILLYDAVLWNILYRWVATLETQQFMELMPILRRTFSKFDPAERKKIGEKAKKGVQAENATSVTVAEHTDFNTERAEKSLSVVALLLGLE